MSWSSSWWMCVGVVVTLAGCGGGRFDPAEVGGGCRDDRDCVERCLDGRDFPGGMCSLRCDDDSGCPGFTWCVDEKGGVCLPECEADDQCPVGYECKKTRREGSSGDAFVCRGD